MKKKSAKPGLRSSTSTNHGTAMAANTRAPRRDVQPAQQREVARQRHVDPDGQHRQRDADHALGQHRERAQRPRRRACSRRRASRVGARVLRHQERAQRAGHERRERHVERHELRADEVAPARRPAPRLPSSPRAARAAGAPSAAPRARRASPRARATGAWSTRPRRPPRTSPRSPSTAAAASRSTAMPLRRGVTQSPVASISRGISA